MTLEEQVRLGQPVTLEEMLEARERRARRQGGLQREHGGVLICFTMNMPGEYKTYPLARRAFVCGQRLIESQLADCGVEIRVVQTYESASGYESYYLTNGEGTAVKARMAEIEQAHLLGRLFDIDVLCGDGTAIKGAEIGRGERRCIVCGGPVWACARSRAHTAEQLALKTAGMIETYFAGEYADKIAGKALRALLYEVCITPKPGLVDRANNGAHRDMDIFTFVDSGCALGPYFRDIVRRSAEFGGTAAQLLPALRYHGRQAEKAMLAATGGVNTHKGLVFSMGLLCAAMGWLYGQGKQATAETLLQTCAETAAGAPGELARADGKTYGETAFRAHGLTGARGEAAAGFPAVRDCGYPQLCCGVRQGLSLNDAGAIALLHLMARVTDTNLIGRSSLERLNRVRAGLGGLLAGENDPARLLDHARSMDREFVDEHLSPGGCADLLALSLMLYFLFDEKPAE